MARIVLADDGIAFDGRTPESRPLGGVESSVVALTEELARRGHEVLVRNMCETPLLHNGVDWRPLHDGGEYANVPERADLYIANRGHRLLDLVPRARRVAFWTHNPCRYVLKWRYLRRLWTRRPVFLFIGDYHAETLPGWVPEGGRKVVPYGLPEAFRTAEPARVAPPPRAIFTSNPLRGLDWLLARWENEIHPKAPEAELHVFSGAATYGLAGDAGAESMNAALDNAEALASKGVVLRGAVPKSQLIDELREARCMLYRGDLNETFCLAVGEAQAMGVPAVVKDLGSMRERVVDGKTGFVCSDDRTFGDAAVRLLTDAGLWTEQHRSALETQRSRGWREAADAFEELLP